MKAAWYGAELFGKLTGGGRAKAAEARAAALPDSGKRAWADVLALIRKDYESNYFISGVGEMDAYDPQCGPKRWL